MVIANTHINHFILNEELPGLLHFREHFLVFLFADITIASNSLEYDNPLRIHIDLVRKNILTEIDFAHCNIT